MKRIILMVFCATVLVACNNKAKENAWKAYSDSLKTEIANRDTELDNMMGIFNDIQEGFRKIDVAEKRVDLQADGSENASSRAKIQDDIRFITNKLSENRERIAQLEQQLKNSKYNSAQLKKAIENLTVELESKQQQIETLQAELAAKNIRIAELDKTVSELNDNVNSLAADVKEKSQTLEKQDQTIHTAWYAIGTKKELKKMNIISNGDVLNNANLQSDYFTKIDIREVNEIDLNATRAELLTSHPTDSYMLERSENKMITLRITDYEKFWSVSHYLVIRVK